MARLLAGVQLAVCLLMVGSLADDARAVDIGTGPVLLVADEVEYDSKGQVAIARGNVEIVRGNRRLLADELRYDLADEEIEAKGNVSLLEPTGETLFADRITISGDLRDGVAEQLRARLTDNSVMAAASGRRLDGSRTQLDRAIYSPCPLCEDDPDSSPLWQLKASEVEHDQEDQTITYRHAFLELGGVPVAYTPYFSHPDPTVKRRSGFLAPTYGQDSELGFGIKTPYYFALAPNYDLTVAPIFTTKENAVLTAEYRHLLESGRFDIAASGTYADGPVSEDGETADSQTFRGHLEGEGSFRLTQDSRWGFDVTVASDDTYLERYGFNNNNVLTSSLFAQRSWDRNFAQVAGIGFQDLRENASQGLTPIVTPLAEIALNTDPMWWNSHFTVDGNLMALTRTDGLDTRRASATGGWELPWQSPIGDRYRLRLSMRTDAYQTNGDPQTFENNGTGSEFRVIPRATVDWGWPLIAETLGISTVFEPVAMATWSTTGNNDDDIPNEDSQDFEFDDTSLLDPNRFPGLDRVEGGASVAYGLRFGSFDDSQLFSGLVGQSYRFHEDPEFDPSTGLDQKLSDIVGRVDARPGNWLNVRYRFRLDRENLSLVRNEIGAFLGPKILKFDVNYLMLKDDPAVTTLRRREEITTGATLRVTNALSIRAQTRRNLKAGRNVFHKFALVYRHPCLEFTGGVERRNVSNRDAEDTTTFSFRVTLKNLGEIGGDTKFLAQQ